MEVFYLKDAKSFLEMTQKALEEDEINGNLIYGLSNVLIKNENTYGIDSPFYSVACKNTEISLIGLMTPPRNLLLYSNKKIDNSIIDFFVKKLHEKDLGIPGVTGELNVAKAFMEKWSQISNVESKISMNLRVYKLTKVEKYMKPEGIFRNAVKGDVDIIIKFITAFTSEINEPINVERIKEVAEIGIENKEIFVWENKNIVSMARKQRPTKNGMAVGSVYTPIEHRGRGYATAVVANLSQNILDSGKLFCTLFTDLSNPTSNSIYQKIGYKPICDHVSYIFESK